VYPTIRDEIVAQRIADLHRQAARQRLLRELRPSRNPTVHPRLIRIWERLVAVPRTPGSAILPEGRQR